jgi:hypothetical protein
MPFPSFSEYVKKRAAANPDPGGYKAAPYGSFPQDVINDGWGLTTSTSNQNREKAVKERFLPKIDSENVIGSLNGILGPSPEERAAEEKRLQEHRRQMHGWTSLFNGLRHLGNLYYAAKGAPGQKLSDPHQQIEQQYQDERKRLADIHAANRNYYTSLYNIRRQMEDDKRRNNLNDAQLRHYQVQDEMARERSRQQDEYNEARMKYYEAISNKNDEQAEYWRLRAEGVPKESAAKIAKDYATAAKANRTGDRSGSAGNSTSETVEWMDNQGRKHRKTTKGGGSSSGVRKGNGSKIATGVNWK